MSKRFYENSQRVYEECFYCGALVNEKSTGDHFPFTKKSKGTIRVPCCEGCHDMKDRFNLKDWPNAWILSVVKDIPRMSRETKIFLAKVMSHTLEENHVFSKIKIENTRFKVHTIKAMLNLLSGFSSDEYLAKKQRVRTGIKKARENGQIKWGRPKIEFNLDEAVRLKKEGYSWRKLSNIMGVTYGTLLRYVKPYLTEKDRRVLTPKEMTERVAEGKWQSTGVNHLITSLGSNRQS